MLRPMPILHRRRARAHSPREAVGVVCIVVFALIGAPASSALRNECDLCPRTCPMHLARDAGGAPAHLGCHGNSAVPHAGHGTPHRHGRSVTRPTCGNHALLPATVLPPVILPSAELAAVADDVCSAPSMVTARHGRLVDPPDTPPPITAA